MPSSLRDRQLAKIRTQLGTGMGHDQLFGAIVTALAGGQPREDVMHAVMRPAVTGEIVRSERGYRLASAEDAGN